MTKIKTPKFTAARHPWRQDGRVDVLNADGKSIASCPSRERANQIANALNRTADPETKLATAREALEHYADPEWLQSFGGTRLAIKALTTISGDTKGDDDGKNSRTSET